MRARVLLLASVYLLSFVAVAFGKDVTGKWETEFEGKNGVQKYKFEFKVDGEKLTGKAMGTVKGEPRETEIKDGKVKGDDISFNEPIKFGDNEVTISYTGKIKGDEIKMTRKVGDFAEFEITLKRSKGK